MVHFVDFITSNNLDRRFSYHFKTSFCVRNHCLILKRYTWSMYTFALKRLHLIIIKCCFKQLVVNVIFILGFKSPGKNGKTALENLASSSSPENEGTRGEGNKAAAFFRAQFVRLLHSYYLCFSFSIDRVYIAY